jgi:hypothetical protein
MKPSTILIALGSFAAGAVIALTAAEGLASPASAARPSPYTDARHGFTITPPAFPRGEKQATGMAVSFFGSPKDGFSSNVGVMVQGAKMTADEYSELTNGQFKQLEFAVLSETRKKVSGKDAILWEYEGETQGRALRWMALAVVDAERVILVTGTALKADYEPVAKEFKASLESFKLGE